MEQLFKAADEIIEELVKKCPRCGAASANKSNPAGRCSSCLDKLSTAKKKPGTYQHEQKLADDALRRQKGKNGTAHKKSKGLGTRKEIIGKVREAYKKHGKSTTLSPDRKNNSEGYSAGNTRMVPKELNRGRHHVNGKKLKAWEHKLKKANVECDAFSKAIQDGDLDQAISELQLIKAKFVSPDTQKKNKAKATQNANSDAFAEMRTASGPTTSRDIESHRQSIKAMSPKIHTGIARHMQNSIEEHGVHHPDVSYWADQRDAHKALAAHKDGSKPLNDLEVRRHENLAMKTNR